MRRLAFPAAAGLDSADPGGRRLHLLVLYGARAVAAGKEHQDVAGEPADRIFPQHCARSAENLSATAGFVSTGRAVASGDGDGALPARRSGAGTAAGRGCRPGFRSAGAVRRRRRADRSRRPWLRAARAGLPRPADRPSAAGDGDHHGAAARLRARGDGTRSRSPETVSSRCIRSTPNRSRR